MGQEGCSNYFILGKLEIDEPEALQRQLDDLRAELLADPYFKDVPSMQPHQKKTALNFHAKDDLPEVRYRVLKLLAQQPVSFYAVVRDKHRVLAEVLSPGTRPTKTTGIGRTSCTTSWWATCSRAGSTGRPFRDLLRPPWEE